MKSIYFKSRTTNAASAGQVRLAAADVINFRNNANSGNLSLALDGSDNLTFNGVPIVSSFTILDTNSIDLVLAASILSANLRLSVAAADAGFINAVATIETDGLQVQVPIANTSTTGVLTNTDWNTFNGKQATVSVLDTATIDLTLTGAQISADIKALSIDNSMIANAAAIAYSKLNLSGGILNADINASAAIARTKIANGTASHVVVNDGSGTLSSEVTLAKVRGGTAQDNTNLTFPTAGAVATTNQTLNAVGFGNVGLSCSVAANALTVALKQADGTSDATAASPITFAFKSNTPATGAFDVISATSAVSVTVPSTATLGLTSGSNVYVYVYAINNAGTVTLGVSPNWIPDSRTLTFTIGTGSDTSASGPYATAGGTFTIKMIGRIRFSSAPNGTYSTGPDEILLGDAPFFLNLFSPVNAAPTTATSATKTPGATSQYQALTSNSIVLQPGVFRVTPVAAFANSGTANYSYLQVGVYGSNGADSASTPTLLSATTGVTVLSGGLALASDYGVTAVAVPAMNAGSISGPSTIISVDRTTTLYVVTFSQMGTAANARITAQINAERIC